MFKIVCCKWGDQYDGQDVNRLYRGLSENMRREFTLCCVTDNASGIADQVEIHEMPDVCRNLITFPGKRFPKLYLFSDDFSNAIRGTFIYLDLDVVVTGDLSPIGGVDADLAVMEGMGRKGGLDRLRYILRKRRLPRYAPVNSSVMVVEPFKNSDIWDNFDPYTATEIIERNCVVGTDQAWIYLSAGHRLRLLGKQEGVYRTGPLVGRSELPEEVRVVVFPGGKRRKPWTDATRDEYPWMAHYYY